MLPNQCLSQEILSFYHADYRSGDGSYKIDGTLENLIWTIKNDELKYDKDVLNQKGNDLAKILKTDLPTILGNLGYSELTICIVPRSKVKYEETQLYFKKAVSWVAINLPGFIDGTSYITRHTNTKTTHLLYSRVPDLDKPPKKGITKDTCTLSDEIKGKNILLIDDVYTKSINIDEDAIQALLDKGAESVVFYSIANTLPK